MMDEADIAQRNLNEYMKRFGSHARRDLGNNGRANCQIA
jgi:hypothetical protein